MKKKDEIILRIDEVSFPNKGKGIYEGLKVIVKNTLPGQTVRARVNKKRNGIYEAQLLEVVERAKEETQKGCSHYELCGGCCYQTLSIETENELKKKQALQLFAQEGIEGFLSEGIVSLPQWEGYRNKCEFSFGDTQKDGELALGMRKKQSYYEVVTLKDCNIVDKDFLDIINATVDFFSQRNISFYHKSRHTGVLRHLVVRKGKHTGEILVNLITAGETNFSESEFADMLLQLNLEGAICGILHTKNDSLADIVQSDQTKILFGRDYYVEKMLGLEFQVSAFSFFQTNTQGAEELYKSVRDYVGSTKDKVIFDLYCGTGTISQILAKNAKKVIGIEIVSEAVAAAKENAKRNQIENCTFLAGDVLKIVDELTEKPDLIVVDPPRDGIHPKAIGKIIDFGVKEIVYVSCKPTSLVRDLKVFQEKGYAAKRVKFFNNYARTQHLETIVLLQKTQ